MSVLLTHVRMAVNARMESIATHVFVPQAGLEQSANRVSISHIYIPLLPLKKGILTLSFFKNLFWNLGGANSWIAVLEA